MRKKYSNNVYMFSCGGFAGLKLVNVDNFYLVLGPKLKAAKGKSKQLCIFRSANFFPLDF